MKQPDAIRVVLDPIAQPAGEDGSGYARGGIVSQSVPRNPYTMHPAAEAALVRLIQNGLLSADEVRAMMGLPADPVQCVIAADGSATVTLQNGNTFAIAAGAVTVTLD